MSSDGAKAFIARWAAASPSERANSQFFLAELCDLLGVARPEPTREQGYGFEFEVTEPAGTGSPITQYFDDELSGNMRLCGTDPF